MAYKTISHKLGLRYNQPQLWFTIQLATSMAFNTISYKYSLQQNQPQVWRIIQSATVNHAARIIMAKGDSHTCFEKVL